MSSSSSCWSHTFCDPFASPITEDPPVWCVSVSTDPSLTALKCGNKWSRDLCPTWDDKGNLFPTTRASQCTTSYFHIHENCCSQTDCETIQLGSFMASIHSYMISTKPPLNSQTPSAKPYHEQRYRSSDWLTDHQRVWLQKDVWLEQRRKRILSTSA